MFKNSIFMITGMISSIALQIAAKDMKISGMNPALWRKANSSVATCNWQQLSLGNGGTCWYLAIHPKDSDCIIESCDMGGTYISRNGSKKYSSMNNPDSNYYNRLHNINSIDFCLEKSNIGYAGCEKNGLFKSSDKGKSWKAVKTDSIDKLYKPAFRKAMICSLAVNPQDPDEVWLGLGRAPRLTLTYEKDRNVRVPRGIAFTKDGGKTWKHLPEAIPAEAMCRKIIITPASWGVGKVIFACTDYGLFSSKDDGKSWQKLNRGLPHSNLLDLDAVYEKKSKKVILAVSLLSKAEFKNEQIIFKGGIWQSSDLGKSWKDCTGNLNFPAELILKSPDAVSGMATPTWLVLGKLQMDEFLNIPANRKNYIASFKGLRDNAFLRKQYRRFRLKESKFSSSKVKKYLKNSKYILPDFHNIRIDPRNSRTIYSSIHAIWIPYGVWKTTNGGEKWICTVRGAQGWKNPKWAAYRPQGQAVFNVNQVWTEKQLMNWGTPKLSFGLWDVRTFDLSKSNPDILYFHTHRVTYKSTNGGKSWTDSTNHFVKGTQKAYMGNGDSNMCFFDLAFDKKNPERMLAWTADCGIMTSTNGGKAWKIVKGCSWGSNQWIYAAAFDPADSKRFYLIFDCRDWITKLKGVYFIESTNFGKSCLNVKINGNGFVSSKPPRIKEFSGKISNLLVDPNSPPGKRKFIAAHSIVSRQMIAAGGSAMSKDGSKGILISNDGGKSWKQSNKGLGNNLNVVDLITAPEDPETFYAVIFMKFKTGAGRPKVIPGGLYISKDSGENWKKITSLPLLAPACVSIAPDGSIYVSGGYKLEYDKNGGIYRSQDKGKTWLQILKAPCVSNVAVSPKDSKLIYCTIEGKLRFRVKNPGILRSKDAGKTWTKVNNGLAINSSFTRLRFKPGKRDDIWVATYGSGLYKNINKKHKHP